MRQSWRTVRVFISSTFRDMQEERDHLVRFVFPRLREALLPRRIHLVDVDLRWGVTSEQDALEVCREIIDECRPRFICILGGRYGWVPPGREHSITADEVRYGVLDRLDVREYRYFYFRKDEATDSIPEEAAREGGYREFATPEEVEAYGQARAEELARERARRLADLKQAVREAGFKPFGYEAQWDGASKRLVGLGDLGNRVYSDLLASIDDEYGTEAPEVLDEFAEEDAAMEAFIEERIQRYVIGSRQRVFDELARFAQADGEPSIVALTGPSGCGKSALLCRFGQDYAAQHPDGLVITHFVGASAGSTDLRRALRRLCHALARAVADEREIPQEVKELAPRFEELLGQAAQGRRVMLILDALNQFDATDNAHTMYWLPRTLPLNVRVIISSLEHPALEALRRRGEAVGEIALQPLAETDSRQIVEASLSRYHKRMSEEQIGGLLSKRGSGNPLYLLAALEELRTLGTYEEIAQRIRELPGAAQPLFLWILKRLEQDPGFPDADGQLIGSELVRQFVSCLGVSRHGLSQIELAELIAPGDPEADPQGNVAALIRLLRPYLMHRGGLLDFYHTQLREAVQAEYLDQEHERVTAHRQLAEYFRHRADPTGDSTWTGDYRRGLSELPYHEIQARMWPELEGTLTSFAFIQAIHVAQLRHALAVVCDLAGSSGVSPVAQLARELGNFLRASWLTCLKDPNALGSDLHNWAESGATARLAEQWTRSAASRERPWIRRLNRPPSAARLVELASMTEHRNAVISVAVSQDGREVLSASADGTLRLWDAASGFCLRVIAAPHTMNACASDARLAHALCVYANGAVVLWDVLAASGLGVARADGRWADVVPAVSPSGQAFGWTESDGHLCLGDSRRPSRLHRVKLPSRPACAVFEDDRVVWAATDTGDIFRLSTSRGGDHLHIGRLTGRTLALAPDPDLEAVWVWVVRDEARQDPTADYPGEAELCCLDLWGRLLHRYTGMPPSVLCVSISPRDKTVITGDFSGAVSLWAGLGERLRLIGRVCAHPSDVLSIDMNTPSGLAATGGFDWVVRLWDVPQLSRLGIRGEPPVTAVALGPSDEVAASSDKDRLSMWHQIRGQGNIVSLKPDGASALTFSQSGNVLLCGHRSGAMSALSTDQPRLLGTVHRHRTPVEHLLALSGTRLAVSADLPYSRAELADRTRKDVNWRLLAIRENLPDASAPTLPISRSIPRTHERSRVAIWDTEPLCFRGWLPSRSVPITTITDLGHGLLALGLADGTLSIWDCTRRRLLEQVSLRDGAITALSWQPRDQVLWVAAGQTVRAFGLPLHSRRQLLWEVEQMPTSLVSSQMSCVVGLQDIHSRPEAMPISASDELRPLRIDVDSRDPVLHFEGAPYGVTVLAGPLFPQTGHPLFIGAGTDPKGTAWVWSWDDPFPIADMPLTGGDAIIRTSGRMVAMGDSSGEFYLLEVAGI
jgi:WD40 repeat protein